MRTAVSPGRGRGISSGRVGVEGLVDRAIGPPGELEVELAELGDARDGVLTNTVGLGEGVRPDTVEI